MLLALGSEDKDIQEKPLNFLPFPLEVQTRFQLLDIFLFANRITESCPIPKEPQGVPACPLTRRWAALGGEAEASWGSRAASPLPHLLPSRQRSCFPWRTPQDVMLVSSC